MSRFERCLNWYYRHSRIFDFTSILGWLVFPIFVFIGDHLDCCLWFVFLWYLIFEAIPLVFASVFLDLCIKKLSLDEINT